VTNYEPTLDGSGLRVAVVAARFNDLVTSRLMDRATEGLVRLGVDPMSITTVWVPGAFELPLAAQRLALSGEFDALVVLGAVIRGATDHHVHVGGQAAAGLTRVALDTGVPVAMGVLTTDTLEQAMERAGGKGSNKGLDAASSAVEMANLLRQLPKQQG